MLELSTRRDFPHKTPLTRLLGRRRPQRQDSSQLGPVANAAVAGIHNPPDENHDYRAKLIAFVGSPLIYVPDSNENPAVGFGVRIEEDTDLGKPVLVIQDHITGKEKRATSLPYPYTTQIFSAVFRLNRNTLIALLHRAHEGKAVFLKPIEELFDHDSANQRLKNSGFFGRLAVYSASK